MGEYGHFYGGGAGWRVDRWGAGPFLIAVGTKTYRFEDSAMFGPVLVCRRHGDPLANQPGERSPFWKAHLAWMRQGRRLADDGVTCIWEPLKPTLVRRTIGRHVEVIEHGDEDGEIIVVR